jgi:cathepsin B
MNVKKSIIKSFGTVMNDKKYNHVSYRASQFKENEKKSDKSLPTSFNPFDTWGNLLDAIQTQGECNCCWAMSTTSALTDRYTIMTLGQFTGELSPYQMIACQGTVILDDFQKDASYIEEINNKAHSQGACNGNTLYSAMDFMYYFGVTTERCVNVDNFSKYGIMRLTDIEPSGVGLPLCQSIIGKDYDTCLDKETAARFYRTCAGYIVDSNVDSIKREIYKWGPVVGCFKIFPDFLEYDGISIYEGPMDWVKNDQGLGGHSVKILGWGNENGIDYWWVANSWSPSWGLSGYFKMKMNIEACQLEQNIVGFIPDLFGFHTDYLLYEIRINKKDNYLRDWFGVDQKTGYRKESIEKIKKGLLKGNIDDLICEYTPDFANMWVGELTQDDVIVNYLKISQWQDDKVDSDISFWWFILLLFLLFVSYKIGKRIQRKNN